MNPNLHGDDFRILAVDVFNGYPPQHSFTVAQFKADLLQAINHTEPLDHYQNKNLKTRIRRILSTFHRRQKITIHRTTHPLFKTNQFTFIKN